MSAAGRGWVAAWWYLEHAGFLSSKQLLSAAACPPLALRLQASARQLHYQTQAEALLERWLSALGTAAKLATSSSQCSKGLLVEQQAAYSGLRQQLQSMPQRQHQQHYHHRQQQQPGPCSGQFWAGWASQTATEAQLTAQWRHTLQNVYRNPHIPDWVRHRLPEFDWRSMRAWRLKELGATSAAQQMRIAIITTLASGSGHILRLLPVVVAQSLQPDKHALALSGPSGLGTPAIIAAPLTGFLGGCWQVWRFLADAARLATLFFIFLPPILTSPMAFRWPSWRAAWMHRFRRAVERAGPAFIKWGQWAASRRDLFPPDLCAELQRLHTQVPSHSVAETYAAMDRALALPVADLFDEFDSQPVASGSIGQIHRAVLGQQGSSATGMPAGTVVAVKVRHPGVGFQIERDFQLMMRLARLTSFLPRLKDLHLEGSLEQFSAPLREQVDFCQEARNLWQFNINFRKSSNVRFPSPLYPLVNEEVLVETFEPGKLISTYIDDEAGKYKKRLAKIGGEAMLQMMLKDNLIHSDLHPGNIMVCIEPPAQPLLAAAYKVLSLLGKQNSAAAQELLRPRIVLLDVGMATALSKGDQVHMMELFRAFSAKDAPGMADATLAFSGASQSCPDPLAFRNHVQEFFAPIAAAKADSWEGTGLEGGGEAMSAVLDLIRQHKVTLPGHICAVVVTTLVLEGWSSQLDPSHSVLTEVEKMLDPLKAIKTRLSMTLGDRLPNEFGDAAPADPALSL